MDAAALAVFNDAQGKGIARKVSAHVARNIAGFIPGAWAASLAAASSRVVGGGIAGVVRARCCA